MELENVLKLIDAVSESKLTSFALDDGSVKLSFEADRNEGNTFKIQTDTVNAQIAGNAAVGGQIAAGANVTGDGAALGMTSGVALEVLSGGETTAVTASDAAGAASVNAGGQSWTAAAAGSGQGVVSGNVVNSPLVGIFYSAASPDDEPFVKVGDTVKKGQVLGIVEAMKLMNEIESDFDGVVKQILIDNEQMVEFGQPMFVIE